MCRRRINLIFIALLSFLLASCTIITEAGAEVTLNGAVTVYSEVNEEFVDPGVSMPENFTLISNDNINIYRIGSYQIQYTVLDDEGVTVKEMTRIVNVVDTTAPMIYLVDSPELFYFGITNIENYLVTVEDNYCNSVEISVSNNLNQINPDQLAGTYTISFMAEDTEGNISSKDIEIAFQPVDVYSLIGILINEESPLIDRGYQNDYPDGSLYYWIDFVNGNSMTVNEDNSITFIYYINTPYGEGNIEFSSVFGEFNDATIIVHIGSGINNYTTAFVYGYDVTADILETGLIFNSYSINYLNIPRADAESYLNTDLINAVEAFIDLFENDFGIILK